MVKHCRQIIFMFEIFSVNEETDDEGYDSIVGGGATDDGKVSKHVKRRRKVRQEDLKIVESDTKDVLVEKFLLLRDVYDELKDDSTRLEYEVETLKDDRDDREEEVTKLI